MRNTCFHGMEHSSRAEFELDNSLSPTEVSSYFAWKRIWARVAGALLFLLFLPVILVIMLLVRLTSKGPAIYRQVRMGKDGIEFEVFKIRTMRLDAEKESGAVLCQPGDSRVTPVGRLLRFLHLDELPQLLNVMRGEMCLIGPRPERPEIIIENNLYERVPGFAERMRVLPGVTGLAQINLPPDQTAECVIPKVKLDLEYMETAGVGLDTRILICTMLRMLGVRHGYAVHCLGLHREVEFREIPEKKPEYKKSRFGIKVPKFKSKSKPRPAVALATVNSNEVNSFPSAELEDAESQLSNGEGFGNEELDNNDDLLRRVPR